MPRGAGVVRVSDGRCGDPRVFCEFGEMFDREVHRGVGKTFLGVDTPCSSADIVALGHRLTVNLAAFHLCRVKGNPRRTMTFETVRFRGHDSGGDLCRVARTGAVGC